MTIDVGTTSAVEPGGTTATAGLERALAEVLAETAGIDSISPDSHFFDDLGLDSLMIAHFCARVRKEAKLPPISVKDCYQNPTIRGLAESLPEGAAADPDSAAPTGFEPVSRRGSARVGTLEYVLCGALQLLAFLAYASIAGLVFGAGYRWVAAGSGWIDVYLRSVLFGGATFVGICLLPIL